MNIISINSKNSIENASKVLLKGGIIIFPTDTVYGIGCILDEKAIERLYQIKNRPLSQPTALLFNTKKYYFLCYRKKSVIIDKVLEKYPKGKVTVILSADNFKIKLPKTLLKNNKVGFRIPNSQYLEKLIDKVGPFVATSANKKGEKTPIKFAEIHPDLLEQVDLVIKSNKISANPPSTIYDLEENRIIRI